MMIQNESVVLRENSPGFAIHVHIRSSAVDEKHTRGQAVQRRFRRGADNCEPIHLPKNLSRSLEVRDEQLKQLPHMRRSVRLRSLGAIDRNHHGAFMMLTDDDEIGSVEVERRKKVATELGSQQVCVRENSLA